MSLQNHRSGVILGKFLPPHLGHKFLFDFASSFVDDLTILVEGPERDPIPGELRQKWVQELAPKAKVLLLKDDNPQYPEESERFWEIWKNSIESLVKGADLLFASDHYGAKLAEVLGAKWIPVDPPRDHLQIRASQIRENPAKYWDFIPANVKPFFTKKIVIFGPESTGKSTLTKQLAEHFNTNYVNEYARTLIETQNGQCAFDDIEFIAHGQISLEEAASRNANRILFCDTDILTTKLWSEELFGRSPEWLDNEIKNRDYYFTLLLNIDLPWIKDPVRYLPEKRDAWLELCKLSLEKHDRRYAIISGEGQTRLDRAIKAVSEFDSQNLKLLTY